MWGYRIGAVTPVLHLCSAQIPILQLKPVADRSALSHIAADGRKTETVEVAFLSLRLVSLTWQFKLNFPMSLGTKLQGSETQRLKDIKWVNLPVSSSLSRVDAVDSGETLLR